MGERNGFISPNPIVKCDEMKTKNQRYLDLEKALPFDFIKTGLFEVSEKFLRMKRKKLTNFKNFKQTM